VIRSKLPLRRGRLHFGQDAGNSDLQRSIRAGGRQQRDRRLHATPTTTAVDDQHIDEASAARLSGRSQA
jgi:hypothetical protein